MKYLVLYHMAENNTFTHSFISVDEVIRFISINPNIKWYRIFNEETGEPVVVRSPHDITCICGETIVLSTTPLMIHTCKCGREFMATLGTEHPYPVMRIVTNGADYWRKYI